MTAAVEAVCNGTPAGPHQPTPPLPAHQLSLHTLLIGIQSSDNRAVIQSITNLISYLSSHDHLHGYLSQSPQMPEIFSLLSNASPIVASNALLLLATVLKSSTCGSCKDKIVRHATNIITGADVFSRLQDHIASDDKRIQHNALRLAVTLVQHEQGLRLLRRLNWTLRIWKQHQLYVGDFLIEALNQHARFMLVTDGPSNALRHLVTHLPGSKISDDDLSRLFSPLIQNLRLLSPVMTQPSLSAVAALHSNADPESARAEIVGKLLVALLSTGPPSHVTFRAAISLNPFTILDHRKLVLDWISDSNRCSVSCLEQYLSTLQCSISPRLSFRYVCNISFMEELIRRLPASAPMPQAVTKPALSAALQQQSRLVVTLAQRCILALIAHGSKQALKLLPDVQVILRSGSGPDDDIFLCCVRSLMRCGVLPRDYAWTLMANQITTGNVVCDLIRTDILLMAPINVTPPVGEFQRAALTATDPVVFSRLVTVMKRHQISLRAPSDVSEPEPPKKKMKCDAYTETIQTRFRVLRMRSKDDRCKFIQKTLSNPKASDDDLFTAFFVTVDSDSASLWASCLATSNSLFRQWLFTLVTRRHGCQTGSISSWPLRMVCSSALPIVDRLRFLMSPDCPVSIVRSLIPYDIRQVLLTLPTIVEYVSVLDLDQESILSLSRRAIVFNNESLLACLKNLYHVNPFRFTSALQTLRSEGISLPDWLASSHDSKLANRTAIVHWYDDPCRLAEKSKSWLDIDKAPPSKVELFQLLRSYRATITELDLKRFDCIEAADRRLENSLFGIRFGPSLESLNVAEELSFDEWLKCFPNMNTSSRWFQTDPRYITPSALSLLEKSNSKMPLSLIETGFVSFTIARGLSSEIESVRACAYTLLSRVHSSSDLISAQAHQVLTLIKNSIYVRTNNEDNTEIEVHSDDDEESFVEADDNAMDTEYESSACSKELPMIPHLSAVLWASMFSVMVSRQGPSHPMYSVICAYMARRAWIPMPTVPDSLRFDGVSFPSVPRLQWLFHVLANGLHTRRDADSFRRMEIWPRLQSWRPLLNSTKLFWSVFASGARIERCLQDLVYEHAVIPFVGHYINDEGALEFLSELVSNMDPAPAAVRGQMTLLLPNIISRQHHLALPVAAKIASLAAPIEFAPVLHPDQLNSLLSSYNGDLDSIDLVALLEQCFKDVQDSNQEGARHVITRLLEGTQSVCLIDCLMTVIQKFIQPDPSAVALYDAVSRHQYRHEDADEVGISGALDHLRRTKPRTNHTDNSNI